MSRRKFLQRSSLGILTGLGTYVVGIEPRWVNVAHHELPIPRLPGHLVGSRAVQISDLHIGSRVGDQYLLRQFECVKQLEPDFVFFTGDYLDDATSWHVDKGINLLTAFPRGKLGTVCVLGNHDYGHGSDSVAHNAPNTVRLIDAFKSDNLTLLLGETVQFAGLTITGLPDYWHGGFDNEQARTVIASAKSNSARLVLSHNPDTVDLPIWEGYQSWVLCGHTHGGQCRFPLIGAPHLPVNNRRYVSGKYEIAGGHRLFINRGLGHTKRIRFLARPEITVFTLT